MTTLEFRLNGQAVDLHRHSVLRNGAVWVPLEAFCARVKAEAKKLEADGPLSVCRGDLCIPLNATGEVDTLAVDGVLFGRLDAFGAPLGLTWAVSGGVLNVSTHQTQTMGLGIGQTPPAFTLPDLYTNEPVSMTDYLGRKTVFYMWASW